MLQELKRFPLVAVLVLATAVSACDDDDPADPGDGTSTVTFTFDPPAGAPAVTSVTVPGEFNDPTQWNTNDLDFAMTEQSDDSWALTVELAPGAYEYKYFINGAWVENMCDDATWGDPVSPQNEGCAGATNNATITVD
ncbi:MAG TPA: hypothetical protein VMN78_05900 [Longimicrobiales bacterium]|nr:hypothetical protein [Longimicrobiales bacterium]